MQTRSQQVSQQGSPQQSLTASPRQYSDSMIPQGSMVGMNPALHALANAAGDVSSGVCTLLVYLASHLC
jgi:hypothetical protein